MKKNILITGAQGYIGQLLLKKIATSQQLKESQIVALDVQNPKTSLDNEQIVYIKEDIRSNKIESLLEDHKIDTIIHLATLTRPPKDIKERYEFYNIEVTATYKLLNACVKHGVKRFIFTSSGAAYGYYPDLPKWIREETPLRGNQNFTYAYHKMLIEKKLEEHAKMYPQMKQFVFRVGTILGENTDNTITAFFNQKVLLDLNDADSRFVFIWDQDVVNCLFKAITSNKNGIYNLAADGALDMTAIAELMQKRRVVLPSNLFEKTLRTLNKVGFKKFDAEQLPFIRYRPVLSNEKVKTKFGYIPAKTSKEVFEYYLKNKDA